MFNGVKVKKIIEIRVTMSFVIYKKKKMDSSHSILEIRVLKCYHKKIYRLLGLLFFM
jgi:hypothetical protein